MILEPVWKLLTIHLPVYVHAVGYERQFENTGGEEYKAENSFFSVSTFDDDEPGIEGMTKQLVDLIMTLIVNPAIHTLIRTGLAPFTYTLSSYIILTQSELADYQHNPLYFIEDTDSSFAGIG